MRKKTSKWSKDIRKAAIDKDMTLKQLAESIGYSFSTVSAIINGRYSNANYQVIASKINEVLGTQGLPERIDAPSDEWCQCVRIELVKRKMNINQLAENLDISKDRLSLVINGRMMNDEIINSVNKLLNINISAIPSDS